MEKLFFLACQVLEWQPNRIASRLAQLTNLVMDSADMTWHGITPEQKWWSVGTSHISLLHIGRSWFGFKELSSRPFNSFKLDHRKTVNRSHGCYASWYFCHSKLRISLMNLHHFVFNMATLDKSPRLSLLTTVSSCQPWPKGLQI